MNRKSPWDEIKTPKTDYNVRQVERKLSIPLHWGKDTEGHCLFVLELEGNHTDYFFKNRILVYGIKVDLRQLDIVGSQGLILTLETHIDRDLFRGLCETLIDAVKEVEDPAVALAVFLSHIKRWKAFMAGRRKKVLSAEEIRGLFAELRFLQSLLEAGGDEHETISAWLGPDDGHQDFIFANTAVEIKAISGRERNSIRISSEDQLESVVDNLYLRVFRLGEMPDSDKSVSLNRLVRVIEELLFDADARELLSDKLASAGYVPLIDYDEPKFIVLGKTTYSVSDEFPKLVRSNLADGVLKVRYDIELNRIEPFKCDDDIEWEG